MTRHYTAGIQAQADIITLLTNNWKAANTENLTPQVKSEISLQGLMTTPKDTIMVTYTTETINAFGIHADDWRHDVQVMLKFWTQSKTANIDVLTHLQNMIGEAVRIIEANIRSIGSGYAMAIIRGTKYWPQDNRNAVGMYLNLDLTAIDP